MFQAIFLHMVGGRVGQQLVEGDDVARDLVHRVGEEQLQGAALALGLLLQSGHQAGELSVLLTLSQNLQHNNLTPHTYYPTILLY